MGAEGLAGNVCVETAFTSSLNWSRGAIAHTLRDPVFANSASDDRNPTIDGGDDDKGTTRPLKMRAIE